MVNIVINYLFVNYGVYNCYVLNVPIKIKSQLDTAKTLLLYGRQLLQ